MTLKCPNSSCDSDHFHSKGTYYRKGDSRYVKVYKCAKCGTKLSDATGTRTYNQKKRRINNDIFELLSMGVSQRKIAQKLGITRATVVRRLLFWSEISQEDNEAVLHDYFARHPQSIQQVFMDELETFETSKLQPVAVSTAVDAPTRLILGTQTASMAPKTKKIQVAEKHYGPRQDNRRDGFAKLLLKIEPFLGNQVLFSFDMCPFYPNVIRKVLGKEISLDNPEPKKVPEGSNNKEIEKNNVNASSSEHSSTKSSKNSATNSSGSCKGKKRKPKELHTKRKNFRLRVKKNQSTTSTRTSTTTDTNTNTNSSTQTITQSAESTTDINRNSSASTANVTDPSDSSIFLNNANDQDVHDWEKMKERMEYCASRNIKWYFLAYKGAKAKRSGMGELKDLPHDPLFSINHTLAMMRYGMSRLIRRTWNTTKKQKYLQHHLNVYMFYHNCIILREIAKKEEKAAQEKAAQEKAAQELLQQKREQKHQLELEQRHLQA